MIEPLTTNLVLKKRGRPVIRTKEELAKKSALHNRIWLVKRGYVLNKLKYIIKSYEIPTELLILPCKTDSELLHKYKVILDYRFLEKHKSL